MKLAGDLPAPLAVVVSEEGKLRIWFLGACFGSIRVAHGVLH